ncbi:MAG: DUF401 family protein [Erysipelotrichaceae bacterium]|jgi:integral membrane protein (TIGR00529 family)|nr:DUF401 family protein [Erysipelotrichaceae bacterium]
MEILKLLLIFVIMLAVLRFKQPLYVAMLVGIVLGILLYQIPLSQVPGMIQKGILSSSTLTMILAFYTITFLQRMLEKRGRLAMAEESIAELFHSRRVNAMLTPFLIGMLPSPGAVLISKPIVEKAAGDSLDQTEMAVVTSYYRHITEAFVPTYASVILALQLTGISSGAFVLGMLPMVAALFLIGYVIYVRRIPKMEKRYSAPDYKKYLTYLVQGIWTIAAAVFMIMAFNWPVYLVIIGLIVVNYFIERFSFKEIQPFFVSAFEKRLIFITLAVMVFKEVITASGVITALTASMATLPFSPVIIYALIFFFGSIIAGSQAIIALSLPLAFLTVPNAGLPLLILLMSMTYIAMQISITHVCLSIVIEAFQVDFSSFVIKSLPIILSFVACCSLYYLLMVAIL